MIKLKIINLNIIKWTWTLFKLNRWSVNWITWINGIKRAFSTKLTGSKVISWWSDETHLHVNATEAQKSRSTSAVTRHIWRPKVFSTFSKQWHQPAAFDTFKILTTLAGQNKKMAFLRRNKQIDRRLLRFSAFDDPSLHGICATWSVTSAKKNVVKW